MVGAATPGTLLTLGAAVLLLLVTISTPILKSLYFLEATIGGSGNENGETVRFGTLGYCIGSTCSGTTLGYSFDPNQLLNINVISGKYTTAVIKGLTYTLILHPIALGFAVLAFILGALSHCRPGSRNCFGSFITGIAAFITIVAFGLDLALFIIAKKRINSINGASASLGVAIWMTLAAWILLFLAGFAFTCSCCGARRRERVRDSHLPDDVYRPKQDRYGEQMRMDALEAEADRKRRQNTLERNRARRDDLPKFAEYETEHEIPLKNDYDDGAYENGASYHQPGLAYSTNHNIARPAAVGAGAAAGASVINGVGQGYGRRQGNASRPEDFASAPPMLNNSAGYGAHNLQAQRQNTVSSVGAGSGMPQPSHEATYVPGVGPQPYRDGLDSQLHGGGSSLTPAPRPYPQVASPPPMNTYSHAQGHSQYASQQQQQQPQYDAYGNLIPSQSGGGSQFSQRRQPTDQLGHPTEYSGATFGGAGSGFVQHNQEPSTTAGGSRMRGARNLPTIPAEPQEIVYDNAGPAHERRQGTVDDGFGLASAAHGSHLQHEEAYDHYASSAYDHQNHQQQQHQYEPSGGQYDHARGEGSSAAVADFGPGEGSQYHDYQSSAGPPAYDYGGQHDHNHYPREKS